MKKLDSSYQQLSINQTSTLNMQHKWLKLDESITSRLTQTFPLQHTAATDKLANW